MKKKLGILLGIPLSILLAILLGGCTQGNNAGKSAAIAKSANSILNSPSHTSGTPHGSGAITTTGTSDTPLINKTLPADDETELIKDPYFTLGVSVIPSCKNPDSDPTCANGAQYIVKNPYGQMNNAKPVWSLGQWGSKSTLSQTGYYANGGYAFSDNSKSLTFGNNGEMTVAVNGESEFNGVYQPTGIALIFGQNISAPGENHHSSGNLSELAALDFSIDEQVLYSQQNIKAGYDSGKNAVIFPINFTIQNLNTASPGYGQYVWFQICTYGDRGKAEYYANGDVASGAFIYAIADDKFAKTSVNSGKLVHLSADILADAKNSVKVAFDRGFLKSANIADYKIGGANIGFELTGLNITTMAFSNFSLKARKLASSTPPAPTPAPAPSPAPAPVVTPTAPEANLAAGFYRIGNADAVFYVNGGGGSCVFNSWTNFLRWGGKPDGSDIKSVTVFPKSQIFYGACP
jgi:hypothetical protein